MALVSILIPMRNAETFISAALGSILQEQTIPLEVIVINDGSTDNSLKKIQAIPDHRVRLINGPCQGVSAALNAGLMAASGDIIMRCDADDMYTPNRISEQAEWLANNPEYVAIGGSYAATDIHGRYIIPLSCGAKAEEITRELCNSVTRTHLGTFAIRARAVHLVGGFRSYFRSAEDIDFQLRLGEVGRIWYQPTVFYHYRLHNTSLTHTQSICEQEFYRLRAYEFQRQRLTQGCDAIEEGCPPMLPKDITGPILTSHEQMQGLLMGNAWSEHAAGHKSEAIAYGVRSVLAQPRNALAWRSLFALAIKPAGKKSSS